MNNIDRLRDVFDAVRDLETDQQRRKFLNDACGDDQVLRQRVDALLAADREAGSFLGGNNQGEATIQHSPVTELIGNVIGPYKIREQIAEGGMGVVYVADQTEPIRRRVALKVIKPGMASKDVVARFEAERQALAMMDHPHIARIIDGGVTDSGQPFFVMELVQGLPVTEYCDQHKLTPDERLQLFAKVCRAIQHAHQKGIIHRDIKPSNVMVASIDGNAVPKVIDFGVAKAVSQKLTNHTIYTQFAQMVGTPLYMSPEQVDLGTLDIDTRSDVYSLGVLLYELLTGNTPFDRVTLKQSGFDEFRRIIREDAPPRPSAAVSTLQAQAQSTVATHRHSTPGQLREALRGELDWIVMKALEKDRTRRYESASAFATDVHRYLDGDVVQACPPSTGYRLKKTARKHRVAITTFSLIALALIVGTTAATWQAARATKAEQQAKRQQSRAEDNLSLALNALDQTYLPQGLIDDTTQNQAHFRKGLAFYEAFAKQNENSDEARWETGKAYHRVGQLYAVLAEDKKAQEYFRRALEVFDTLESEFPDEPIWRQNQAVLHEALGWRYAYQHRAKESLQHQRRAVEISESLASEFPDNVRLKADMARARKSLAFCGSTHKEMERLLRLALQFYEQEWLATPSAIREETFETHDARALSFYQGEVSAEDEFVLARATIYAGLGHFYRKDRAFGEAESTYRKAAELQQVLLEKMPDSVSLNGRLSGSYKWLVSLLEQANAPARALAAEEEAVGVFSAMFDKSPQNAELRRCLVGHQLRLVNAYFENNQPDKARSLLFDTRKIADPSYATRYLLALVAARIGDDTRYGQICAEMLDEFSGTENTETAYFTAWTCSLAPRAIDDYRPAITLAELAVKRNRRDPKALMTLGAILLRDKQIQESLKQLTAADEIANTSSATRTYLLAMVHHHLGNAERSKKLLKEANDHDDHHLDDTANRSVWNRLLTLRLLRDEAEKMTVGTKPLSANQPPTGTGQTPSSEETDHSDSRGSG